MNKYLLISLIFLSSLPFLYAQTAQVVDSTNVATDSLSINDGPYIFIEDGSLVKKSIIDGELSLEKLPKGTFPIKFKRSESIFENVEKVAALSDIHGQYDLAVEILKNNKIIDDNLHWNFGNGHLVIVGDIFDRGDKVTEMLWLIYNLEIEAKKAGGNVHYLLGNHEYMVLQGDNRYVNPKYLKVAELMDKTHPELFGTNTVLGRWLRSKSTILKINGDVFVHGGISKDLLTNAFKIEKINKTMIKAVDKVRDTVPNKLEDLYFGNTGPIWYRGYFYDNLPIEEITEILEGADADHIVVGHCSNDNVVALYDKRIFGVDSSIKLGEYGELLFILKNKFSRGSMSGERLEFNEE